MTLGRLLSDIQAMHDQAHLDRDLTTVVAATAALEGNPIAMLYVCRRLARISDDVTKTSPPRRDTHIDHPPIEAETTEDTCRQNCTTVPGRRYSPVGLMIAELRRSSRTRRTPRGR